MNGQRAALGGLALAGVMAGTALAASSALAQRSAARFYQRTGPRSEPVQRGSSYGGGPVVYHRAEASRTFHTASLQAVKGCLPSDDLHPVRLPGDRAVVAVSAFRHSEVTSNGVDGLSLLPYGEVMVAVLVTRRPAPPLLPLVAPGLTGFPPGAFVLHLPVTHQQALDGGRLGWNYPKFIADMDFEDSVATLRCRLSEGGAEILTHTVWPGGRPSVSAESLRLYSALDGALLALEVPMSGITRQRWGPKGGRLELGDHQVADELRRLDISPAPFLARRDTDLHLSLNYGHPVGTARQYLGYIGAERDLGRYVVCYGDEPPIDMYAPYAPTAGPRRTLEVMAPA